MGSHVARRKAAVGRLPTLPHHQDPICQCGPGARAVLPRLKYFNFFLKYCSQSPHTFPLQLKTAKFCLKHLISPFFCETTRILRFIFGFLLRIILYCLPHYWFRGPGARLYPHKKSLKVRMPLHDSWKPPDFTPHIWFFLSFLRRPQSSTLPSFLCLIIYCLPFIVMYVYIVNIVILYCFPHESESDFHFYWLVGFFPP